MTNTEIESELEFKIVCPVCHAELEKLDDGLRCQSCDQNYPLENGFPDLIVGGRFDDPDDPDLASYEEECNEDTTRNFWVPTISQLVGSNDQPQVLSMGCGTGVDVDIMVDAGFGAVGVDCGNRTKVWPRRRQHNRLFLANGKNLPLENESFDVAFCGCVFPHVGVVGDSYTVSPTYHQDRLQLAQEMTRVVRPGGKIVVASPNRLFPADLFHGREAGSYKVRPYWPGDPFLLSANDYRDLFLEAGCSEATALPVENYWGFIRAKNSLKGQVFRLPVRTAFWLASREPLRFLRNSPLNPWIVVGITR